MKIRRVGFLGAALATVLGVGGCLSRAKTSPQTDAAGAALQRLALAEATVAQWSDNSAQTARLFMEKYGDPDEVHYGRLVWNNNGPWRRTVVRDVRPSYVEGDDLGVIEQTIDASLTPEQAAAVSTFDNRVQFNARSGELSARSDREALNMLRLNLAGEVAEQRMSAEQARISYAKILEFEESGKTSPYLLTLRFGLGSKP